MNKKRYSVKKITKNDCMLREYDTFESSYFCHRDSVWLDDIDVCKFCKYKDCGDTKEQLRNKLVSAIVSVKSFDPKCIANEILNYLGIKE